MTSNQNSPVYSETGYLTVRVSTASGAIPLENAAVNIRGGDVDDSDVIFALTTNSDGLTPTVALPTPPRASSEVPQTDVPPYAVYNVDVFAKGYAPVFFNNVPVFSGINSVQPAVLLPETENRSLNNPKYVDQTPIFDYEEADDE